MNIGILTINNFGFHPNLRLWQAADRMGHSISLINPYDILTTLKNGEFDYSFEGMNWKPDVILPRQGSPMGDYGLVLLHHFIQMGVPLVNGLKGVTITRNQYITLQTLASFGVLVPESSFLTKKSSFSKAVESLGGYPVVVKQVDGMGGDGVIRVDRLKDADSFLEKHLKERKGLIVQEFIPPEGRMDVRLLVVGDRVVGAMKLEPCKKDFRANIHQNGRAEVIKPSKLWIKIAVDAAKACCLEIAGVDMIIEKDTPPRIIEVNYSPGFRGLEAATELDIAHKIIEYVHLNYNKKARK